MAVMRLFRHPIHRSTGKTVIHQLQNLVQFPICLLSNLPTDDRLSHFVIFNSESQLTYPSSFHSLVLVLGNEGDYLA